MSDDKAKVFLANNERSRAPKIVIGLAIAAVLTAAGGYVFVSREPQNPPAISPKVVDERAEMEKQLRAGNVEYIEAYLKDAAAKHRGQEAACIYRCVLIQQQRVVFANYDGILERKPAATAIASTAKDIGELLSLGTPIARAEIAFKNIKGAAVVKMPMEQARRFGEERKQAGQPSKETFEAYTKAIEWTSFDALYGPAKEDATMKGLSTK